MGNVKRDLSCTAGSWETQTLNEYTWWLQYTKPLFRKQIVVVAIQNMNPSFYALYIEYHRRFTGGWDRWKKFDSNLIFLMVDKYIWISNSGDIGPNARKCIA